MWKSLVLMYSRSQSMLNNNKRKLIQLWSSLVRELRLQSNIVRK
jgi:hypothetical protein